MHEQHAVKENDDLFVTGSIKHLAAGNEGAVEAGFNANDVIKQVAPLIGGGGGGKPGMAQAGGKNADGLDAALAAAREMLSK